MSYKFDYVVPVGEVVQFFKNGLDGGATVGILTAINEDGVADLVELPRFGGMVIPRMGVRFVDDPWHLSSPEQSRENGAWQFRPATTFKPEEKKEETKKTRELQSAGK